MATKKQDYGNDSISSLKGADRVRKRPGVIFGSDGLDGCEHAVFEILSNSIDEARVNTSRSGSGHPVFSLLGTGGPRPGHHRDAVQ